MQERGRPPQRGKGYKKAKRNEGFRFSHQGDGQEDKHERHPNQVADEPEPAHHQKKEPTDGTLVALVQPNIKNEPTVLVYRDPSRMSATTLPLWYHTHSINDHGAVIQSLNALTHRHISLRDCRPVIQRWARIDPLLFVGTSLAHPTWALITSMWQPRQNEATMIQGKRFKADAVTITPALIQELEPCHAAIFVRVAELLFPKYPNHARILSDVTGVSGEIGHSLKRRAHMSS